MSRMLSAVAALATASLFVVPTVASAETAPSVRVHYGDLDLASPAGAKALKRRISRAASQVCGDLPSRDLRVIAEVEACRAETIAAAQPAVQAAMRDAQAPALALNSERR